MKKAVLALMLLAGSAFAGPRISVGIGLGIPARAVFARPVCPGPGYFWVDGYYGPSGIWEPGCWRAPAAGFAFGPRFAQPHYFAYEHGHEFRHGFRR